MGIALAAAIAGCLAMLGTLVKGDLDLVRSITGSVEPGTGFWVFLAIGSSLVLVPAILSWGYFVSNQSRRIDRIEDFVGRIMKVDAEKPDAILPLPLAEDEAGRLSATFNLWQLRFGDEMREYMRSREDLKRIDEEKSEFLSVVSHELRTPLNTILGFSQLLIDGIEGSLTEGQIEDLRIINTSGKNLLGLINDIIDLSAIESGTIQIQAGTVDMDALSREVHQEFMGQVRGKGTTLLLEAGKGPVLAHADKRRVYQILNNLVSNAIKFTPKGTVKISLRETPPASGSGRGQVEVEVEDTGAGIPSSDMETIFSEFMQSGSASMRRKGTGLGLAISKRLLDLQGGTIRVWSEEGKGSRFTFTLQPAAEDLPPAERSGPSASAAGGAPPGEDPGGGVGTR